MHHVGNVYKITRRATLPICALRSLQSKEGVNYALRWLELFSYPELGPPLASGASRCSAPQPGTVYLLRYTPPNCRWTPSSAGWRLSFSSTRDPSSGTVVTDQRVWRRIQIFRLDSTQLLSTVTVTVTEALVLRHLLEDRGRIKSHSVSWCPQTEWNRNVFRSRRNESVDHSSFSSVGSLFHASGAATEKSVANSSTCPRHDEVATQWGLPWFQVGRQTSCISV